MFICNKKLERVRFFDGKNITILNGDFKVLYQKIKAKYSQNSNIFLGIYGNWQDNKKECFFYDKQRKKCFQIEPAEKEHMGVSLILKLLFAFTIDTFNLIENKSFESEIFWHMPTNNYKIQKIKSETEILSLWVIHESKYDEKTALYTNISQFSLARGNYTNQCYIDTDAMGIDKNKAKAKAKSLSEAIERATGSSSLWETINIQVLSHNNIDLLNKYKVDTSIQTLKWNYLTSLYPNGQELFLSENLLYYPVTNTYHYETNSSGMATHTTLHNAIYWALLELIERDAFIYSRLTKSNKIYKLPEEYYPKDLYQEAEFSNSFFLLEAFVPVYVILCLREKEGKSMVSLSCAVTLHEAITKAYLESHNAIDLFNLNKQLLCSNSSVMKHIFYYLDPDNSNKLDWIRHAPLYNAVEDNNKYLKNYEEILQWFQSKKLDLGYFEYKTKINQIFNRNTVRVYSSHLLPIYFWNIIPSYILQHPRLTGKIINLDIHPLG